MPDKQHIYYGADSKTYLHALEVNSLPDPDDGFEDWELESLADDAASDYHDNYDGNLDHWPIEFHLFTDKAGTHLLGSFTIDRDFEPVFSSTKI
jgi:hypothetical protein